MKVLIVTTQGDFTVQLPDGIRLTDFIQDIVHNGYWLNANHTECLAPAQLIRFQLLNT